jgi:cobalt/nickel transport system permease protein
MISDWLGHHHSRLDSPIHRLPAAVKLGAGLIIIAGSVLLPLEKHAWFVGVALCLGTVIVLSRLPLWFLGKRLLWLSPFVLGVALANAFQPGARMEWQTLTVRSMLCLTTVVLVSNTTPFTHIVRVLRMVRVPALLVTTLALMHRYLFVLVEEAERMQRARLSRTFLPRRRQMWRTLSTVAGQLFVRASERAERIYDAMCARGWR